jgi:para-nitrobenzyl esterase
MQNSFSRLFSSSQFAALLMVLFFSLGIAAGCSKGNDSQSSMLVSLLALNGPPPATGPTVTTASGNVRGAIVDGAKVWKGIPYAKPPMGSLRWKAPVDPDPWTGVRDATTACSECIQQYYDPHWFPFNAFIGSEDCLYLDIYAPNTTDTNLPVYVYIHGGSNNFGSAKQYDGTALAKRGNIITVFIQYRLNAMGFLTHPALRTSGTDSDKSGNYGILDIQKALSWVQTNIAAFGGDPTKVVVGGQSAGAHDIMNLIVSPLPANFRGAFIQSVAGPGLMDLITVASADAWTNTTIDGLLIRNGLAVDAASAATYRAFMTNADIETFLRAQTAELIVRCRRDGTGADGTGVMLMHSAIRDGVVVRDAAWTAAIAAGNYNKVPIVNGGARYEWKDFAPIFGTYVKAASAGGNTVPSSSYTWLHLWNIIGIPVDFSGIHTLDQILPLQRDKDIYATITDLKSRSWRLSGVDDIIRALKTNDPTNPVYSFQFKWAGGGDPALANFATIFGASHGMDVPFFHGRISDAWGYSFTTANKAGREALQGAMMDYLISFVKTLDPNPSGSSLLTWPQWDTISGGEKLITLDADLTNYVLAVDTNEILAADLNTEIAAAKVTYPETVGIFTLFGM